MSVIVVAAGGPWDPNYGCFLTDVGCQAQQSLASFMASTIRNLGDFIATLIAGAFNGPQVSEQDWSIAHSQFLFWVAVTAPVVLVIALVQIGIAMIMQDWSRIGRTAVGAVVAIPFSALCVWLMQQASSVSDGVTQNLTTAIQGGDLATGLLRAVGIIYSPVSLGTTGVAAVQFSDTSWEYSIAAQGAESANSIGQYVIALFVVGLMLIAALFLMIAMAIRDFGLLALAAMAPIGLMMIGQPKLGAWAGRWASLTTGLLLAKPLAAGVILLAVELTGSTGSEVLGVIVAIGAIVTASFSPLWATRLVSFAGAEVGNALQKRASIRDQVSRGQTAAAPVRGMARLVKTGR